MGFISVAPVCILRTNNAHSWRGVVSGIVCVITKHTYYTNYSTRITNYDEREGKRSKW